MVRRGCWILMGSFYSLRPFNDLLTHQLIQWWIIKESVEYWVHELPLYFPGASTVFIVELIQHENRLRVRFFTLSLRHFYPIQTVVHLWNATGGSSLTRLHFSFLAFSAHVRNSAFHSSWLLSERALSNVSLCQRISCSVENCLSVAVSLTLSLSSGKSNS